jgi:hypothetical protein
MQGHSHYVPKSGIGKWMDARLPLPRLVYDSFVAYPVPKNLNYWWTFGGISSIMLVADHHRHHPGDALHAACRPSRSTRSN